MLRSRGPGCEVSVLPISGRRPGRGEVIEACLLDAGKKASELELLRTVASGLGVVWGRDDLGAWAMVPNKPQSAFAAPPATEPDLPASSCEVISHRFREASRLFQKSICGPP
ncbi:MAG: hypothetical protein RIS79_246 [Verrucomicrobiota bacterium]